VDYATGVVVVLVEEEVVVVLEVVTMKVREREW
jgi:hypothetical protein